MNLQETLPGLESLAAARNAGGKNALEKYETPPGLVRALKKIVPIKGVVYEPCAGDLAIARFFRKCWTNDIDKSRPAMTHVDATTPAAWYQRYMVAWVVTNPPFSEAMEILRRAWYHSHRGVAFLLRLSFLEPTASRAGWLKEHTDNMSDLIVFNPRPVFRLDKHGRPATDSVTVAWMVWQHGHRGGPKVAYVTDWKEYNYYDRPDN